MTGYASGATASCSIRHPSTRPSAAVSSMEAMLWPDCGHVAGDPRRRARRRLGWAGHGHGARRGHLRIADEPRARPGGRDRPAGRRARLPQLLDGRDHRARGVLAARRRRAPPPRASTSAPACWPSSCARRWWWRWPGATLQALHPDRDILLGIGISSPVVTAALARRRPTATARSPGCASTSRSCERACPARRSTSPATSTRSRASGSASASASADPKIVVGALNPKMLRLAGEVADGVLLNYLPASHVPWSVEQVRKGGDATVYAYVHAGVCERRGGHRARPARPLLLRRGRRLRPQLRAGRLRRRGGRDPRAPRRRRPGRARWRR